MRTFNPKNNPYAAELHKLRIAPEGRYTALERVALGRVIAAKLYEVTLERERYPTMHQLWRNLSNNSFIEFHVVFDDSVKASELHRRLQRYRYWPDRQLIVLIVTHSKVVEIFNGLRAELRRDILSNALDTMRSTHEVYSSNQGHAVLPRSDEDAAESYYGERRGAESLLSDVEIGVDGSVSGSGGNGPGSGDNGRGNGNNGRGNGGDDGNDGPGGTSGRGGAGELINHPVLFAVERHVYDAILDEI